MRSPALLDRNGGAPMAHLQSALKEAARPAVRRLRRLQHQARVAGAAFRGDVHIDARSEEQFVDDAYRLALGRPADPSGRRSYAEALRSGMPREQLVLTLATSEESINKRLAQSFAIQDLKELRPDLFREVTALDGVKQVPVVTVSSPEDLDWLEQSILEQGYYEKPGIWTFGIDDDKRRMGELLSLFQPRTALEIGCSSGAVIACLLERGVDAEGVEISSMAVRRAAPEVRQRIHVGDVLTLDLPGGYDLVYGLDIFEHFNPNRIDAYISRVVELTSPGGFVYANLPTWGEDRVYGTIWEPYVQSWVEDVAAGRLFRELEVDAEGYPLHGHLIWSHSTWWEERFAAAGLRRETHVERALHARFDAALADTPARKAFYVFSRHAEPVAVRAVIDRVAGA